MNFIIYNYPSIYYMDYSEFRSAGHYLIDYIADYLQHSMEKPLFAAVEPSFLHHLFEENIPGHPQSLASVQQLLEEKLIPYCTDVNHPGYMGLITPSPNAASRKSFLDKAN